jgi:hypothetical protein
MQNSRIELRFPKPYYNTYLLENARNQKLGSKAIVLNLGKSGALIAGQNLTPLKSAIFSNSTVEKAERLVCIELGDGASQTGTFEFSGEVKRKWQHVREIFPLPHLEKTQLWRSEKETAWGMEFNLWFASAGTDCGLHNKHGFFELHTQIFGLGCMQKFRKDDKSTLYHEVLMTPGFTHDPFYDARRAYPWHQYHADSDCVWLATEFK